MTLNTFLQKLDNGTPDAEAVQYNLEDFVLR